MKMTLKELMIEVVGAMTKYVNIKRINKTIDEFLANGGDEDNLNDLLLAYYVDVDDYVDIVIDDDVDLYSDDYIVRRYKKLYDYTRGNLKPIKGFNTGCVLEYTTWSNTWWQSWAFNLEKYVEINNIEIIDFDLFLDNEDERIDVNEWREAILEKY